MTIDVCLSPEAIHLFNLKGKIVVVTDIFRATSTMTTALANGVKSVIPVSNLEDCNQFEGEKYIKAAERGGKIVEGFEFGNSPFDYMNEKIKGKTLIMTTTNGTKALNLSKEADAVLIGSFLNLTSTVNYLKAQNKDIIVFCAGWKGRYSLEDSLYAGAVVNCLLDSFEMDSDSAFSTGLMFKQAEEEGLLKFASNANHFKRLSSFSNHKDIEFCMKFDVYDLVGKMEGDNIIKV